MGFFCINNMIKAVYNFFRMFKKDSGAHFTYNLGVGLVRLSLMFFLWALVIVGEWYFLSSPKFIRISYVSAKVSEVTETRTGKYVATLKVIPEDGKTFEQVQFVTRSFAEMYEDENLAYEKFAMYRLVGRGNEKGKDYGTYISNLGKSLAEWQYYRAVPGSRPPVQTWGIWVSLVVSLVLFAIGRRQITLSMKYPRSDVPVEVSGTPAVAYNKQAYEKWAGFAVREDMRKAAEEKLLTGENVREDD